MNGEIGEMLSTRCPPARRYNGVPILPALPVRPGLTIPARRSRIHRDSVRGAGGQNVNKVANAVHLRFDIAALVAAR